MKILHQARASDAWPVLGIWIRRLAWVGVGAIIAWLLWMTLRPSQEVSLPGVRMGTPLSEINLRLLSHKVEMVRRLLASDSPSGWRAARTYLLVDVLGNIAVFVPLGMALAVATYRPRSEQRLGARWWLRIIAAGMLLSLGIELVQLAIPTRATDVDDVILNTLGTAAGAFAAWGFLSLTSDR